MVVVAQVGERVDIPDAGTIDRSIEHTAPVHIPVAIDILRTGGAATGLLVVGHHRRDAVVGGRETQISHLGHRVVLLIAVVEEVQALRERRFQAGITARDVERVAIVVDVEQLRHRGLRRRSAVVDAQVGHLREAVAEVECRGDVEHGAGSINVDALIVLYELRALRLEHHAHVEVVLLVNFAEHQLDVVRVVLVFRIAAQRRVTIGLVGLRKAIQVVVPLTIVRSKSREEVLAEIREVEGLSVALVERVVEAIAKLQERTFPERFAISGLQCVVVALRGSEVEAVGLVGGVVAQHVLNLEEVHIAGGEVLRCSLVVRCIGTQREVATPRAKLPVKLQHTTYALRVAIADALILAPVHHQPLAGQHRDGFFSQRIVDVFIWVLVVGCRRAPGASVVFGEVQVRTEHDVGHRVRRPLEAHLGIPGVGARVVLIQTVGERTRTRHEVLARGNGARVAVAMVPANGAVNLQEVSLLIVDVYAYHLRRIQSRIATAKTTHATSAETTVACVVGIAEGANGQDVVVIHSHQTSSITVVRSDGHVVVGHIAVVHALLHREVERGFFVAVVNASDAAQVTLLVVYLDALDNRRRQILHGSLRIASHKFLTTHLHLFHFLSVDGDFAVVVDLCTRDALHQFLGHRAFWHAVGRRVVNERILFQHNLLGKSCDLGTLQHHGIALHRQLAHSKVFLAFHLEILHHRHVADA